MDPRSTVGGVAKAGVVVDRNARGTVVDVMPAFMWVLDAGDAFFFYLFFILFFIKWGSVCVC